MNIDSGAARLVLLCPAWKKHGTAKSVKKNTAILHSRADDVVPFSDSKELAKNSHLPASALIEVGSDHRLADPEPLETMLKACEEAAVIKRKAALKKLEREMEKAVVEIICRLGLRNLPLLPAHETMQEMAKAAVAVYEKAVDDPDNDPLEQAGSE